jgi:hypothetical protein
MRNIKLSIDPFLKDYRPDLHIFSSQVVVRCAEEARASKGKGTADARAKKKRKIDK